MICFLVGLGAILGGFAGLWLLGLLVNSLLDGRWSFDTEANVMIGLVTLACFGILCLVSLTAYLLGCGLLGHKLP